MCFVVQELELGALCTLSKHSTTELHPSFSSLILELLVSVKLKEKI
jgi:hypothetical protein